MACMKLGSKPDVFHLDGDDWHCSTGLPSDIIIEVGDMAFHLHKFPLLSRSKVFENLIAKCSSEEDKKSILQLHDLPGGAKTFLLVAKICYHVKVELTAVNAISLRCAAEYLQMTDDYGEGNLITQTENFLNEIFASWSDSVKALETCEEVLPQAEGIHIVSRCINSLAMKTCADPSLFSWPMSSRTSDAKSTDGTVFWNGICTSAKPQPVGEDWWYEDVSCLRWPLYRRLILTVASNGMKLGRVVGAIMYYAKRHLSLLGREPSFRSWNAAPLGAATSTPETDQRILLEQLVELLPDQKGLTPSNFLLRLLRTAILLEANQSCRENLEKRVGAQLDQAALEDLLIPTMGYSVETLYDIDCLQRMLDHFILVDHEDPTSNCIVDEGQMMRVSHSLTPMSQVASLIDSYLAEVSSDVNLKPTKLQSLAAVIPDYARSSDDGLYRAIDIYLKAHPWLIDSEREQLCRLMNCQKLSLEASTHAAQNERLPLRVIVQVLFFEQLRLRTSIAGWFYVSDSLDTSRNPSGNLGRHHIQGRGGGVTPDPLIAFTEMKEKVSELEKEYLNMKKEIDKLDGTKGSWNMLKRFGLSRPKPKSRSAQRPSNAKSEKELPLSRPPLLNANKERIDESVD